MAADSYPPNPQRLELAEKRAGIDAQLPGSGRTVAVVTLQCVYSSCHAPLQIASIMGWIDKGRRGKIDYGLIDVRRQASCGRNNMHQRISIDPNVCHGKPVIRGTRVLVANILGAIGGGDSIETVLEDYPNITREDVLAAFEFGGELSRFQETPYETSAL